MVQKIRLGADGTCVPHRMQPYHINQANNRPAKKLNRLQKLIKSKEPIICVVRGEGIGDVMMTTPTVHAIRKTFGTVQLHYATNTKYLDGALVDVLRYNPDIDEILERELLDDSIYDLVINLHCPCIYYEKPGNPPMNRIDLFAKHAGVAIVDPKPQYFIQQAEIDEGKELVSKFYGKKIVVVQPYASTERRSLDVRKFKAVLQRLSAEQNTVNLVLTHGSDFSRDIMWDSIPGTVEIRNLGIREIAGLIVHSNLVLCPDSSVLHLTGALDIPTVALFGPTHPDARVNHYPHATAVWKGKDFAPCPCVVGESIVLTSGGYKEIQHLQPGEVVKTVDSNWNKITKIHKNPRQDRQLHQLEYFSSNEPLTVTEDHKMLVVRHPYKQFRRSKFVANREWIPAKNIKDKDYLCIPRNKENAWLPEQSLAVCQLAGIYAAEGHLRPDRKSVVFTVGTKESALIQTIKEISEKTWGATVGIYPSTRDKSTRVEVYSEVFLAQMLNWFGRKKAKDKELPFYFLHASDNEIAAFLSGYFVGDGYTTDKESVLSTASRKMAYGVQELLTRFGVLGRVYKRVRNTNYKENATIYRVYINTRSKKARHIVDDDYIYVPIKSNTQSSRNDEFVYDITVENSTTFCIQNVGTWDCWYSDCKIGLACWTTMTAEDIYNACAHKLQNETKVNLGDLTKRRLATIKTEII